MPYVARDKNGAIIAVFKEENECAHEHLSPWNSEWRSFVGQKSVMEETRDRHRMHARAALRQIAHDVRADQPNQSSLAAIDEARKRSFSDVPPDDG